jgi:two-component system cell cycle sensor histidine kinase/response regulator CckA
MSDIHARKPLRILHLEDSPGDRELVRAMLEAEGFHIEIRHAISHAEFQKALETGSYDIIISDFTLPSYNGMRALGLANQMRPSTPFIFFSGTIGEEAAIEGLKNGATDYVLKQRPDRLAAAVRRAVTEATEHAQLRAAEEKLRHSEARFRAFMDNSPLAAFVKDEEGHYIYFNRRMERWFGVTLTGMQGKTDFDFLPVEAAQRIRNNDNHVLSTGNPMEAVEVTPTHDGKLRHTLVTRFPIPDPSGRSLLGGVAIDITERVRAEERIREQAAMLDKAQDAICVIDMDERVQYWNESAERLYGWPAAQAIGKHANEVLFTGDPGTAQKAFQTVIDTNEWNGELRQLTKGARDIVVSSRWTLMRDERGNPKSILLTNTDITERKKIQAQFLRAQRMESIGALAGGIAHDLNNVLSPILMTADFLRRELTSELSLKMLETVKSSAERGAGMVQQILSFARGLSGEHSVLQLKHVVTEIVRLAKDTFPRSIQIEVRFANRVRPVKGDATQLQQVLMNLCVNARDAMPRGGKLIIETDNVDLTGEEQFKFIRPAAGTYVVLSVADTGDGIAPDLLAKIFEPFFTTKEEGRGTGLGLSTVLGIVKSHGGFLDVVSTVGKGSIFSVYLPATATPEDEPNTPRRPMLPPGSGELILLVDDEIAILEINKAMLESFNYQVVMAKNGEEALAIYRERQREIRVVITDVMMPVMDGPTLVRKLQSMDPHVKVMCLTGIASRAKLADAQKLVVQGFLHKPYSAEQLLTTVRDVLRDA